MTWVRNALFAIYLLLLLVATPYGHAASCPNASLRSIQGSTTLPDCMALEMVTPVKKSSQPAYLPSFSRDGERVLMIVQTALAETPGYQYYGGDRYVASRTGLGWSLSPTSPQEPAITSGGRRWGSATGFTPDLSRWAQIGATQAQYGVGMAQLFGGGLDGSFSPLSPALVPIDDSGSDRTGLAVLDLEFAGTAADLSATVLKVILASTAYLPDDPRRPDSVSVEPGGDRNSYVAFLNEAGEPDLELLARDNDDVVYGGRCGAHLGGAGATFDQGSISSTFNQGAISPDGERIFITTRPNQPWDEEDVEGPPCSLENPLRVMKRTATPAGPVISEVFPGGPSAGGDDLFQAASADGSRVYILTPRKLTASDTDAASGPCSGVIGASSGCDLYLFDENKAPSEQVVQVSDGTEEADVLLSATAISGDGSRAYFVAQGILTADTNPEGDSAAPNQPNLYLYETDSGLSFIGTLSPDDSAGMWATKGTRFGDAYAAPVHGATDTEGGDGHVLAFASKAPLTEDDEDTGDRDVFRYDALTDTLERISKAAPGGSDNGEFDATVNPAFLKLIEYNFGETTRWVSEDGEVIAFATAEPLVPGDSDEAPNPYAWDAGELGAAFAPITDPPAAAPVGEQIAFSTQKALLPRDGDVAKDVYVARANGGFPEPPPPVFCNPLSEDSCEGPPSPEPGAVPVPAAGANVKAAPKKCKKGQVKRKGKCVKKKAKAKRKRAGSGRRARR